MYPEWCEAVTNFLARFSAQFVYLEDQRGAGTGPEEG